MKESTQKILRGDGRMDRQPELCKQCGKGPVLCGLNGQWLCQSCFEDRLKGMCELVTRLGGMWEGSFSRLLNTSTSTAAWGD